MLVFLEEEEYFMLLCVYRGGKVPAEDAYGRLEEYIFLIA